MKGKIVKMFKTEKISIIFISENVKIDNKKTSLCIINEVTYHIQQAAKIRVLGPTVQFVLDLARSYRDKHHTLDKTPCLYRKKN